jgi:Kef-type K+ transport system membrane component KefB
MNEIMAVWADWLRPSAGAATVQWSVLLAVAAAVGHLVQRRTGMPKVVGYSITGALAGLAGFSGGDWPLDGIALFLLELGVSVVLFEAGGRLALRWLRHNPMVLLQSLLESLLAAVVVYYTMRMLGVPRTVAEALGIIAMSASPEVLSRVVMDTRASGPVTERALALSTLSALYALTLVNAHAGVMHRASTELGETLFPVLVVLGVSFVVGAALALILRIALRFMAPTSENTAMLLIASIAAASTIASHFGGSAPLAALLAGLILKQLHTRPWAWPRQLGTASSLLTMLMFVLVSVVAAKAPWNPAVAGLVGALVIARAAAKIAGVSGANWGSGTTIRQAMWTGCALAPMSSVALLMVSQFAGTSAELGRGITSIALPAILIMEVLGAILATFALHHVRETSLADNPEAGSAMREARG